MPSVRSILELCYDEHAEAIRRFALSLTASPADADDVLQDVFCRLARKPELLHKLENTRAFLLRMTRNLVIDGVRRTQVRKSYAEEQYLYWFEGGGRDTSPAESEQIAGALARLPVEQREVLHLKIWEEQTLEEVSRTLGIPVGTAASRYRYGMNKLRELLRPFQNERL